MVTIAQLVRNYMEDKPFIQECLNRSLINFGALAEYFKKEIETELNKTVKLSTISMALRRYANNIQETIVNKLVVDEFTDISSKANLIEFSLKNSKTLLTKLNTFYEIIDLERGDTFSVLHGTRNVTILTNLRHTAQFEKVIKGEEVIAKFTNLGAVYMQFQQKYKEISGVWYLLTKELAFHNISVLTVFNVDTEGVFIFKEQDLHRAFQILLNLIPKISNSRE